jgi:signal peptidase II
MAATAGCDRVTKHIAVTRLAGMPDREYLAAIVRLQYAENTGGFLSIGANLPYWVRTTVFTVGTAAILIAGSLLVLKHRSDKWTTMGLCLTLAGGASNLFDRIVRGSVVDFMNIGVGSLRTGIFNVADVAVLIGLLIIATAQYRSTPSGPCS